MRTPERRSLATSAGIARLVFLAAVCLASATAVGDEPAPPPAPVLHLIDGGYLAGGLVASPDADVVRWHGAAFAEPLDFPADAVDSIRWPLPEAPPEPAGDVTVELTAGDVLFGTLVGLDDEALTLDTGRFGRLRISRDRLRAIHRRREASDLVYFGPNGLEGWSVRKVDDGAWADQAGQPSTTKAGAALDGDINLPARAAIEFELSWERKPDFALALGVGVDEGQDDPRSEPEEAQLRPILAPARGVRQVTPHGCRFEVWADRLVAVRETERQADLVAIETLPDGPGHLSLRAYLDQEHGRLIVETPDGRRVADLNVPGDEPEVHPGIRLTNIRGDVRLERLVVRRWDGELPPEVPTGQPSLVRDDGSVVAGAVERFDAGAGEFTVEAEGGEAQVPLDRVSVLVFAPAEEGPRHQVGLAYHDGTRIGGTLGATGPEAMAMEAPGIEGAIEAPVDGLRSLVVFDRADSEIADEAPTGLLELEGTRLRGRLADAEPRPDASCLAWQPLRAASAGRLRPGISGKIVYREEAPRREAAPRPSGMGGGAVARFGVIEMSRGNQAPQVVLASQPRLLYLRSGDIVPVQVTAIGEDGVRFESPFSENSTVAHERVKAAYLTPGATSIELTDPERERLLTLPRMQQANPPTHLIRSRNGDYLRGRLVGLDDEALRVEVRLVERRIPRDLVAEIIWLHPEDGGRESQSEEAEADVEANAVAGPGALRVQALRNDGVRLTFVPERVKDSTLVGTSEVLGTCRVPLDEVDQILIGDAIEVALKEQEAHRWTLRDAEIPKAFRDDASTGGTAGTESAMVGQPAPDFTLDLLDGGPFTLADHRGEVVILDFWATWCGPCLQAMPQVERVAAEFRDRGVRLVAVNLQETPDQIRPMLERHEFDVTVALDRDGVAAARYGVTAIPQTVVIAPDGTVARLFVGGGPQLGDQLREALEGLLAEGQSP